MNNNRHQIFFGFILLVASLDSSAFVFKEISKEPIRISGDVNVRIQQPIDNACWIWAPGHERWGVSSDLDAWADGSERTAFSSDFFKFRCRFSANGSPLRFAVSADERYVLYLDGEAVARGPVRGMVDHWYYHSYEATGLDAGEHTLEAVVWQLGQHAPIAQLSYRGGFILKAEDDYDEKLSTGKAAWQVARLVNTTMTGVGTSDTYGAGSESMVTGCSFGDESPDQAKWRPAAIARREVRPNQYGGRTKGWRLFPADRPEMLHERKRPGTFRAARAIADDQVAFVAADADSPLRARYLPILSGERVTVPAHSTVEIAWDLDDYYCGYPELTVSGGRGGSVVWGWTESLRQGDDPKPRRNPKVNRGEFIGARFAQTFSDEFKCDGRSRARFTSPWWRCGRWCRLVFRTAEEPMTIDSLAIAESRYPLKLDASFRCDDRSLDAINAISLRTLQCCMHEMTFDCPYYEQQMYPGDTRIQLEILNTLTRDDRMQKFVMEIFDHDRRDNGLVGMNFPSRGTQECSTYTMCWLMMFGDYLRWHDDAAFLKSRRAGMNASLLGLGYYENDDGLLEGLPGWSFMDWVDEKYPFDGGCAPDGAAGVSALNNLQYLLAMQSVASVEEAIGELTLAAHWRAKANRLGAVIKSKFMSSDRGVLADNLAKDRFSEHAQAMAILAGILSPSESARALETLEKANDLSIASTYFAYYLFRAYAACGRADLIRKRLIFWRNFIEWGGKTAFETQNNQARSDCHAWSSCPLYACHTVFAGVEPASPFFRTVRVAPQPAGLKRIEAVTPSPKGLIKTDFQFEGDSIRGKVVLPPGLSGTFEYRNRKLKLSPGVNSL